MQNPGGREIRAEAKSRRKLNPGGAEGTFFVWTKGPQRAHAARPTRVFSHSTIRRLSADQW